MRRARKAIKFGVFFAGASLLFAIGTAQLVAGWVMDWAAEDLDR